MPSSTSGATRKSITIAVGVRSKLLARRLRFRHAHAAWTLLHFKHKSDGRWSSLRKCVRFRGFLSRSNELHKWEHARADVAAKLLRRNTQTNSSSNRHSAHCGPQATPTVFPYQ